MSALESATSINLDAIPKLLSEVASNGEAFFKNTDSIEQRLQLLAKAQELVCALETPRETMLKHIWTEGSNTAAIAFGVKSGLWVAMSKHGDCPQKVADLAEELDIEFEILQRLMRHIAACGYIKMVAPDVYQPNNFSKSLVLPIISSGYDIGPDILYPIFLSTHDWLKKRNYTLPDNKRDTAYSVGHKTDLTWFEHISTIPEQAEGFNNVMVGYFTGRPAWMDEGFYPVEEHLLKGFDANDKDAVLFVDIAGGVGHYTEQFRSRFPNTSGRLVLQDLPGVIQSSGDLHPRIEKIEYDFLTEQPVKGARAYYTHWVLHDWPDSEAVKIVNRIKEAMRPGYSKFLVHEHVVTEMGHVAEQTALDFIMMTGFGSKERTAAQWSELLEKKCGLEIVKIWTIMNGVESIIECELPA